MSEYRGRLLRALLLFALYAAVWFVFFAGARRGAQARKARNRLGASCGLVFFVVDVRGSYHSCALGSELILVRTRLIDAIARSYR